MKVYLLKPIIADEVRPGPWASCFGRLHAIVIRANTSDEARRIAAESAYSKEYFTRSGHARRKDDKEERPPDSKMPPCPWLEPEHASCDELTSSGKQGVVLEDFTYR